MGYFWSTYQKPGSGSGVRMQSVLDRAGQQVLSPTQQGRNPKREGLSSHTGSSTSTFLCAGGSGRLVVYLRPNLEVILLTLEAELEAPVLWPGCRVS